MQQAFGPQQIALDRRARQQPLRSRPGRRRLSHETIGHEPGRIPHPRLPQLRGNGQEQSRPKPKTTNPRWWMACNYEPVAKSEDGLAWELRGQGVKCMTENDIIAADGTAQATGKSQPDRSEMGRL